MPFQNVSIIVFTASLLLSGCTKLSDEINASGECIGCDLSQLDFTALDQNAAFDFSGSTITGNAISDLNFVDTDLEGATFTKTVIRNVDFSGANLKNIAFNNVEFVNVNFLDSSSLERATFQGAKLKNVTFNGVDLRGANIESVDSQNVTIADSRLDGLVSSMSGNSVTLRDTSLGNAYFDLDISTLKLMNVVDKFGVIEGRVNQIEAEGGFFFGQLSEALVTQYARTDPDKNRTYTELAEKIRKANAKLEELFWSKYETAKINRDEKPGGFPQQILHDAFKDNDFYYVFPIDANSTMRDKKALLLSLYDGLGVEEKTWFDRLETGEHLKIQDDVYREALNKSQLMFCTVPVIPAIPSAANFSRGNAYTHAFIIDLNKNFYVTENEVSKYESCVTSSLEKYSDEIKRSSAGLYSLIKIVESEEEERRTEKRLAAELKEKAQQAYKEEVYRLVTQFYDVDTLVTEDYLQMAMMTQTRRMSEREKFNLATSQDGVANWAKRFKEGINNSIKRCISDPFFKKSNTRFDVLQAKSPEAEFNLTLLRITGNSVSKNKAGDTSGPSQDEIDELLKYGFTESAVVERVNALQKSVSSCSESAVFNAVGL